jgi:hypothetical protein
MFQSLNAERGEIMLLENIEKRENGCMIVF